MKKQQDFARGAHLKVDGMLYSHHGIYVGKGDVIHHPGSGSSGSFLDSSRAIEKVSLEAFSDGRNIKVVALPDNTELADKIIKRAYSALGDAAYCVLNNNCEHFAFWCYGFGKSEQADAAKGFRAITTGAAIGFAIIPIPVVGSIVGGMIGAVIETFNQD